MREGGKGEAGKEVGRERGAGREGEGEKEGRRERGKGD